MYLKIRLKYECSDVIEINFFSISNVKSWCYKAFQKIPKK
jgi:hypothetical protein